MSCEAGWHHPRRMRTNETIELAYPLAGGPIVASSEAAFLAAYGQLFEHSAWVVERAWALRPFADAAALYTAFRRVLDELTPAERLRLIRAHPELADRVSVAKGLTESSTAEQASAGLDQLSVEEFELFQTLNGAYRGKNSFPFIICARLYNKGQILDSLRQRLHRSPEEELQEAIRQISQIVRLRLWTLLSG
jgi:2-oxo-4-hydroxy-4-carboxy-5-ureidoimidazoline decarboxylase